MNTKEKASLLALSINCLLTLIKFTVFFFTGSIVILSESFHSFSDIFTSFFTYFSVLKSNSDSDTSKKEFMVSVSIGLILLLTSANIFFKVLRNKVYVIKHSLGAGLIFLFFASLSYIVYKFEFIVSNKENDGSALYSDSIHSKADMFASLITGFTLIFYYLGFNFDRFSAFIIGLLIFISSFDIFINAFNHKFKSSFSEFHILDYLFSEKLINKFSEIFGFFVKLSLVLFILVYLSTCFVQIKTNEMGVLERFGIAVKDNLSPGLYVKYPWPFEKIYKAKTEKVNRELFGNIPIKKNYPMLWGISHGENSDEKKYISGDDNFFYPYVSVSYRISNLKDYFYNLKMPKKVIKNILQNSLTKAFISETFYDIATVKKTFLERNIMEDIQKNLDKFHSGIKIISVLIRDVHPPVNVSKSFEDVIAAMQDKITSINVAREYRIVSFPAAKSAAVRKITSAKTISLKKISKAFGNSKRLELKRGSFAKAPDIIKTILFFDLLKDSLAKCRKVISDGPGVELWMNYEKIFKSNF